MIMIVDHMARVPVAITDSILIDSEAHPSNLSNKDLNTTTVEVHHHSTPETDTWGDHQDTNQSINYAGVLKEVA